MLYSSTKIYLKTKYSRPSLEFSWDDEDNKEYFHHIRKHLSSNHIFDDKDKLNIKKAFKDFFESVGYIIFQLKDKHIRLKILAYKIQAKDSVNLDLIKDIISSNEHLVKYDYKGNQNQILLPKDLKHKIYDTVEKIDNEEINKNELVRYAIRDFLELEDNDIIVFKDDSIFIKLLSQLKRKVISDEDKETIANRYNGIDEDELIFFYTEYFSQDENRDFFYFVAKSYVERYFLEKEISNAEYEKNVFTRIQDITIYHLNQTFDSNEAFFKGFSGYIFRIHFKEVFEYMVDFILNEIAINNTYMVNFLKYYSLNIIVINGVKYKVPILGADNGLKWNVISIMSVAKVYMKAKQLVEDLHEDLYDIEDDMYDMYLGEQTPIEYNNELLKFQNEITEDIAYELRELKTFSDKYDTCKKADDKKDIKVIIQEIKNDLLHHKKNRENIGAKMLDKSIIAKYRDFEKELESCVRQLKSEERILKQNENSYQSVKNALTKALFSKKKRI